MMPSTSRLAMGGSQDRPSRARAPSPAASSACSSAATTSRLKRVSAGRGGRIVSVGGMPERMALAYSTSAASTPSHSPRTTRSASGAMPSANSPSSVSLAALSASVVERAPCPGCLPCARQSSPATMRRTQSRSSAACAPHQRSSSGST